MILAEWNFSRICTSTFDPTGKWFCRLTRAIPRCKEGEKFPEVTTPANGPGTAPSPCVARPSSIHPNGFNVTYTDGHVQFMSPDIQYNIYAALMTPYGVMSRVPGNSTYPTQPIATIGSPTIQSGITVSDALINP